MAKRESPARRHFPGPTITTQNPGYESSSPPSPTVKPLLSEWAADAAHGALTYDYGIECEYAFPQPVDAE